MGKTKIMAKLNKGDYYDLEHLKRDTIELGCNLERVMDMYLRMTKVLAKHVDDDISLGYLLDINKNLKLCQSNLSMIIDRINDSVRLEQQFPWE